MSKKVFIFLLIALMALSISTVVYAKRVNQGAPEFVPQLGEKDLQKVVFIRYAPDFHAARVCDYDGVCDADENPSCADCKKNGDDPEEPTNSCYTFLAGSKPKWNWVEDYTANDSGLLASSNSAVVTWESATSNEIFGQGIAGDAPWGVYDYTNTVLYGNYDDPNVIGVTAIWFRGKNIYEYDILYDTDYFPDGSVD